MDGAVKDADGFLKQTAGQLGSILANANTTVANVNDVVTGLKQGRGAAGMLLQDPDLAAKIRKRMTNVQQASANLGDLTNNANGLITDVQSRNFPLKFDETIAVVKSAASNVDASTRQIRQTIEEVSNPDENGATPGVNIRESLSNASTATSNVADGTEALKHNFLLRGFFLHRGYYDLTGNSADKYRQDRLFTRRTTVHGFLAPNSFSKIQTAKKSSPRMAKRYWQTLLRNTAIRLSGDLLSLRGIRRPTARRINSRSRVAAQLLPANISSITFA
jgi:phospholipid/cholesterol/gamma-HCH transport system substrate-binding protein